MTTHPRPSQPPSSVAGASPDDTRQTQVYDLMGLGFGPSNLALMAVVEEEGHSVAGRELDCLFIERKPKFIWHPNMLIEGTRIQLSFLKDLVTLRNPRSHFSFLSYLQAKGRLDRFANLRNFFPSRLEFNDYYSWVADHFKPQVRYGHEVVSVEPVVEKGSDRVELVQVVTRDVETARTYTYKTRNLVVATGGVPTAPDGVDLERTRRVFHSQEFLDRLNDFPDLTAAYRFAVVGSGQSAAEIFRHLYNRYPNADVTAAIRRFAYKPADSSHFVNEIFMPQVEDFLFDLPADKRRRILQVHRDTNYSCVEDELIEEIYADLYAAEVAGEDRFRIRKLLELRSAQDHDSGTTLFFQDLVKEKAVELEVDCAFLATGFVRPQMPPVIGDLSSYLVLDSSGRYKINRQYQIVTKSNFMPRIFLQGFCEDTHGLSDTLLSTLPTRVMGILRELRLTTATEEAQSPQLEATSA